MKGKVLGRQRLEQIGTLFTPDTILRWHRTLVAKKWDYSKRRKSVGRPPVGQEIVDLVVRFARENVTWGYDRIQGALVNLGHMISDQTVGNILKEHGIEPAPERKRQTTWKTFLKAHWDCLAAIDFTTVEVWTKGGLVTYYLLFAWGQKTATSCKYLWLRDFSHRALLGFRPTSIALPSRKGDTERITGEFMAGCLPQRAGLFESSKRASHGECGTTHFTNSVRS